MDDVGALVEFDVLVVADATGTPQGAAPRSRPRGDQVTHCRRWFAEHGAECHDTGFGLACRMPREAAEALFGVPLTTGAELPPPAELSDLVERITVPAAPELFE